MKQGRRDAGTVPISLSPVRADLRIQAGPGQGTGTIYLVGFDPRHSTPVRGGENGAAGVLPEANVVRWLRRRAGSRKARGHPLQAPTGGLRRGGGVEQSNVALTGMR